MRSWVYSISREGYFAFMQEVKGIEEIMDLPNENEYGGVDSSQMTELRDSIQFCLTGFKGLFEKQVLFFASQPEMRNQVVAHQGVDLWAELESAESLSKKLFPSLLGSEASAQVVRESISDWKPSLESLSRLFKGVLGQFRASLGDSDELTSISERVLSLQKFSKGSIIQQIA